MRIPNHRSVTTGLKCESLLKIEIKLDKQMQYHFKVLQGYQITVYHVVIDTHKSITVGFHMLNHIKVLQSNLVKPKTRCCTLMYVNQ